MFFWRAYYFISFDYAGLDVRVCTCWCMCVSVYVRVFCRIFCAPARMLQLFGLFIWMGTFRFPFSIFFLVYFTHSHFQQCEKLIANSKQNNVCQQCTRMKINPSVFSLSFAFTHAVSIVHWNFVEWLLTTVFAWASLCHILLLFLHFRFITFHIFISNTLPHIFYLVWLRKTVKSHFN